MRDSLAPAPASANRPRCPRCGANMGALVTQADDLQPATANASLPDWYCGCCGLVAPAPSP